MPSRCLPVRFIERLPLRPQPNVDTPSRPPKSEGQFTAGSIPARGASLLIWLRKTGGQLDIWWPTAVPQVRAGGRVAALGLTKGTDRSPAVLVFFLGDEAPATSAGLSLDIINSEGRTTTAAIAKGWYGLSPPRCPAWLLHPEALEGGEAVLSAGPELSPIDDELSSAMRDWVRWLRDGRSDGRAPSRH